MNIIYETSTVQVTEKNYVAFDGTVFKRENDCLAYEDDIRIRRALDIVPNCADAQGYANVTGGEQCDYHSYYWFRPRNEDDLRILEESFRMDKMYFNNSDIGKWICIEYDDEDGYACASTLDEGVDYHRGLAGRLGLYVTVTERAAAADEPKPTKQPDSDSM